jgi:hypothetical protein
MVQVDIPGAFAVGQIFALLARPYLEREQVSKNLLRDPVSLFLTLIYAPVGMFLLVGWPAWEVMYWTDWVEGPAFRPAAAAFYVGFYMVMVAVGYASFLLGHRLLLSGKAKMVKVLAVAGVVLTILPFFLWPLTWLHVGTYAQYHAVPRATSGFFQTPSFLVPWAMVMSYLAAGTVLFGLWLRARAARLARPEAAATPDSNMKARAA